MRLPNDPGYPPGVGGRDIDRLVVGPEAWEGPGNMEERWKAARRLGERVRELREGLHDCLTERGD